MVHLYFSFISICIIYLFLQCVSTMIIVYIIISPLYSYLYIHWIFDFKSILLFLSILTALVLSINSNFMFIEQVIV